MSEPASAASVSFEQEPAAPAGQQPGDELRALEEAMERPAVVPALEQPISIVTREESTVGRSPAAVFVVTNDMIRRSGARSIPEALRMVPGINVARIDSNKWAVSARGFNDRFANKLLVQIDGRTVYNPIFSGVYWDAQDVLLEDIDRIELIRGPGATVWGSNAVNGIINIVTKRANDTQGGLIYGGGGTEERGSSGFRYGGQTGDLSYRVYGKWFERDNGFNTLGDAHDDWRFGRLGARLDWQASECDWVTLQGDIFDGESGRRDLRPTRDPAFAPDFIFTNTEDETTSGGDVIFRWTHELGERSDWTLQVYYDLFRRRSTHELFLFDIDTIDVDFQHQFPLSPCQQIVWGVGYRFIDVLFEGSEFDDQFIARQRPGECGPRLLLDFRPRRNHARG